ncbi:MAG: hypothetical protein PHR24_03310 [Oscillospiraceae bacterium]|nr:hypothetical protein [Oscillospiraceae bacterium]
MIILIIVFIIMLMIDLPSVIRNGKKKILIAYGLIFTFSFTICLLLALEINIKSPLMFVDEFYKNILHFSY